MQEPRIDLNAEDFDLLTTSFAKTSFGKGQGTWHVQFYARRNGISLKNLMASVLSGNMANDTSPQKMVRDLNSELGRGDGEGSHLRPR